MKRNVAAQEFSFSLFKAGARIANPTLAGGDFKRDLDGAGQNNVTTLPSSDAAGLVTWLPSAAETNADVVSLLCNDAAGAEWEPLTIVFYTETDTSVAAILVDTAEIGAAGAGLTALGDARIANLDVAVSSRGTADTGDAMTLTAAYDDAMTAAQPGDQMDIVNAPNAVGLAAIAAAVWANATRTLTSLGALLASIAAAVWGYATRTLTSSSTAPGTGLTAGTWTVLRGDVLPRTFATIAADASITKVQFSFRNDKNKPDTASILAVDSTTGLIRLNGAAPGIYTATFTLPAGVLTVPPVVMARLSLGIGYYDIQVWRGAAVVQTIEMGSFSVTDDVTRTVTP